MPTPEAEEIIKGALDRMSGGCDRHHDEADILSIVQTFAPRIDALCLRLISANEEAWRRTVRLEREARAGVEKRLKELQG